MTYLCGPNTAVCLWKQYLNYLHLISWRLKAEVSDMKRTQVCAAATKMHPEKKIEKDCGSRDSLVAKIIWFFLR